jgi:rhodanese-related sulfurtransferase
MSVAEVTPVEASRLFAAGGYVYLDVRTVPEFANGHPPSALNVPIAEINPATGQMERNARFLPVVRAAISRDARLIVGCKSGGRSAAACEVLHEAGYRDLRNMVGGFGGVTDETGQVLQDGWSTLGYPVERGGRDGTSYESLAAKACL